MPRTARLDAPGVVQHIMIRKIFRNNKDKDDFIDRLFFLKFEVKQENTSPLKNNSFLSLPASCTSTVFILTSCFTPVN